MSGKQTTKERVLQAACKIFSEKGFHEATVAEICETAGANIASVNYHFGDKEKLYDEVWHYAFSHATATYPVDGVLPENSGIEEGLYIFASAILHRIFSEGENGLFAKLLYREMASPTLALEKIATDYLFPQSQHLASLIQTMPDSHFDAQSLFLCTHSIIGQCAFYNFSRPLREHMIEKKTMTEEEIDRTARHIAYFSLGGLKEIQKDRSTDYSGFIE